MKKILLGLAFAAALLSGCQKINDLESRLNTAENDISALKSDVAKLQAAVEKNYSIVSYTAVADGYALTFSDGTVINLKNGKDGEPGAPGAPGKDGDAFFKSVEIAGGYVTITLMDGQTFKLPISVVSNITSLTYIPEYTDGCVPVPFFEKEDASFDVSFLVKPAALAASVKGCDFAVNYVSTITRAEAPKTLSFKSVEVSDNGVIEVKGVNASSLSDAFFAGEEGASIALVVIDGVAEIASEFVPAAAEFTGLLYAGEKYHIVTMADGNVWMADNLRYIPEGLTPKADFTDNSGIWYPATVTWDGSKATVAASTDPKVIKAEGYLYTEAVALNGAALPVTDFEDAENTQGICPDGWHIPTAADWIGLVGGCSDKNHTVTTAPYYDSKLSGASLEALNADGFNLLPYPYINQGKSYLGSVLNKDESNPYYAMSSMLYFASSTARSDKQSYGAMITNNATKRSVNVAYNTLTNGVAVRCIKNK